MTLERPTHLRVLLVEPSAPVRERLRRLLEEAAADYLICEAGSLAEARARLAERPFDAVILELSLPDGHGSVLLAELKRDQPACLAIVMATLLFPTLREHCRRLRADHVLEKAAEFEQIPRLLRLRASTLNPPACTIAP